MSRALATMNMRLHTTVQKGEDFVATIAPVSHDDQRLSEGRS